MLRSHNLEMLFELMNSLRQMLPNNNTFLNQRLKINFAVIYDPGINTALHRFFFRRLY